MTTSAHTNLADATQYEGTLADAVREAARTLDLEEHRYVERYAPCPHGCEFTHDAQPKRLAGPDPCPEQCFYGTIEDEDAPQMNPLIGALTLAAASLEAVPVWIAPLVRYALADDDAPLDFAGAEVPERIRVILEAAFPTTCSACGRRIVRSGTEWLDEAGGYCMPTGGALTLHEASTVVPRPRSDFGDDPSL